VTPVVQGVHLMDANPPQFGGRRLDGVEQRHRLTVRQARTAAGDGAGAGAIAIRAP
jgi:hypothetical protein